MGQLHVLPRRNIAVRFTSVSGSHQRVPTSSLPASENLHITGREQVQQCEAKLLDHLVGAGKQHW
jgi:hypothetical protein